MITIHSTQNYLKKIILRVGRVYSVLENHWQTTSHSACDSESTGTHETRMPMWSESTTPDCWFHRIVSGIGRIRIPYVDRYRFAHRR